MILNRAEEWMNKAIRHSYLALNISSGNGLLPWRHQAITCTNIDISKIFCGINPRALSQVPMNLIHNMCSEIMLLKLLHIPGANELK